MEAPVVGSPSSGVPQRVQGAGKKVLCTGGGEKDLRVDLTSKKNGRREKIDRSGTAKVNDGRGRWGGQPSTYVYHENENK